MKVIDLALGERSYPICIGRSIVGQLPAKIEKIVPGKRCAVITDSNVAKHHMQPLITSLRQNGVRHELISFPAGEQSKQLAQFEQIIAAMVEKGVGRDWAVIAFGGGVVGDLAGFVAACYMRGLPYIHLPTTLLAQVDSSVGGKVGINHPAAKNLVGAFYQPKLVWIDTEYLGTLPQREILCGLAEIVKYGVIFDRAFFEFCEKNLSKLLRLDFASIRKAISRSCEIKAEIVAQDERDWGRREILNFGHTIGHAIEAHLGYREINHGEAVLWGMLIEAILARRLGIFPETEFVRFRRFLAQIPLKASIEGIDPIKITTIMRLDKKARDGQIRFILPDSIGSTQVFKAHDVELIVRSLQDAQMQGWFSSP